MEDTAGCPNLNVMRSAARVPDDRMKIWIQAANQCLFLLPFIITVESQTSSTLKRKKNNNQKAPFNLKR